MRLDIGIGYVDKLRSLSLKLAAFVKPRELFSQKCRRKKISIKFGCFLLWYIYRSVVLFILCK